jgi:hypothetical protein
MLSFSLQLRQHKLAFDWRLHSSHNSYNIRWYCWQAQQINSASHISRWAIRRWLDSEIHNNESAIECNNVSCLHDGAQFKYRMRIPLLSNKRSSSDSAIVRQPIAQDTLIVTAKTHLIQDTKQRWLDKNDSVGIDEREARRWAVVLAVDRVVEVLELPSHWNVQNRIAIDLEVGTLR